MTEEEDQQDLQKYLDTLNKEFEDNQEDEDGNLVLTIRTEVDEGDDDDSAECNNGTIVMDADGNYYFHRSDKTEEVKTIKKKTPVKRVAATIVKPTTKLRNTAKISVLTKSISPSSSTGKQTTLQDAFKNTKKELTKADVNKTKINKRKVNKKETILPNSEDPLPSELDKNDEQVYEFDETEQNLDNNLNDKEEEYKSKGMVKPIKSNSNPTEANKRCMSSKHMKNHSGDRPYKCSICERGFKSNENLKNHVNIHMGRKPHACKDCEKTFTSPAELVRHERYRHTHIKPHKCTECDYSSVEMSKLRRHMLCHTGERPYQCPHCTYASQDTFKLKRHIRTHTGEKPYECDICHARFTQSNSLKSHRLIHTVNDKPVFQCHLCPTTCGRKTDLRSHITKLHSSDQPIPCKRCGKELPDRYSYKMHVKTHEGEKCYRCTYCAYASITQRHLESHMLIHTDTKPFVCELCQMSFRQKQLLSRHVRVSHTKNYQPPQPRKKDHKCPHCDKAFAFNGNLIRHMETHDPLSQIPMEKQKLKMGRMKRLQPDGSVATVLKYKNEDSEEQGDEEEVWLVKGEYEEEEEDEEEYDDFNDEKIQYVYEEYEYEGEQQEESLETKPCIDIEMECLTVESLSIQKPKLKTIAVKQENDGTELMELQVDDDPGVMIIEVMQDDEEEVVVDNEQEPKTSQHQVRHNGINNNATNATVTKNSSVKSTFENISDCFGFEVDDDDEEEDEENRVAVKLLQIIEQE